MQRKDFTSCMQDQIWMRGTAVACHAVYLKHPPEAHTGSLEADTFNIIHKKSKSLKLF